MATGISPVKFGPTDEEISLGLERHWHWCRECDTVWDHTKLSAGSYDDHECPACGGPFGPEFLKIDPEDPHARSELCPDDCQDF